MSGFVFFAIIVFVVIPVIKNIAGAKPAKKPASRSGSEIIQKNWAQVQKLLQEQMKTQNKNNAFDKRNARGHSGTRKQTHSRMHARDGNTEIFPETHMAQVRKRDQRDRSERNRIEAMLNSKENHSIFCEGNIKY